MLSVLNVLFYYHRIFHLLVATSFYYINIKCSHAATMTSFKQKPLSLYLLWDAYGLYHRVTVYANARQTWTFHYTVL